MTKWYKFGFCVHNSGFDKYLFQLIVLFKPDFNYVNNFTLSWVDKVSTGTSSLVSVIINVAFWLATLIDAIKQFADKVKIIHN